jgi:hypothetical protein
MVETMYYHDVSASGGSVMEGKTYLNAVIAVSEILHGLELLIDDTNAGLVCAVYDTLDILGTLAHRLQLLVQPLGSFNGGL